MDSSSSSRLRVPHVLAAIYAFAFFIANMRAAHAIELKDKQSFFQTCDASAGISVGEKFFVVASDEDNLLRVYDYKDPGAPVQCPINLNKILGLPNEKEADLEAVAQVDDTSYWIASHGRKKNGDPAPARRLLFALQTKLKDQNVECTPAGKPYRDLVDDMIRDPNLARFHFDTASTKAPESPDALNIEGLCEKDGQLLIGLRNPILAGKALLLPLTNVKALLAGEAGTHAEFGEPIELDLQGRGVRSIEYDAAKQRFWIVAGRFDKERDFALYSWKGPGNEPTKVDLDFGEWNPESIILWPNRPKHLQILSDDGERTIDSIDPNTYCKDLPEKKRQFRSGWLKIED